MKRLSSIILMCLMQILTVAASTFSLNVEVTPAGAASPNTRGGTYEEGEEISLRVSGHTGFVFKGWYTEEEMVSSATNFRYTMPSHDVTIQAKFEYDPAAPDNPAMPDTTTYYSLTAAPSPAGAASLNLYEGRYAADASVNMRANGRTGYVFDGWQNDKGETLSSATSFSFKMPAHNTHLTAVYHYDPTVPADPNQMGTSYTTVLKSRPAGGGSFNTTSVTLEEGSNARVYAYTNTGFRFLRWEDEDGNMVSENRDFYYVMPHGGGTLYGVFDYDPEPPANPAKNYWNKELGEVIVDDFTPGSLNSALSSVISGSNRNDVTMITVAGVMTSNDFGIANNYPECTLLDLSRVTGVMEIPSYAFDNTTLETVTLPATIEKIGTRAFENCKQLAALSIYAMTPPTLENNVFHGIPDGLIVYVPAAAVAQYQDADVWKDFTILPIQEDVRSLTVALPSNMSPESFARMWLEIRNTKNGQRLHYVMTDRQAYTFANIIRNTTWDVTLRNERGDIFGQINNVEVKDDDISVEFKNLSMPQTVSLTVLTPDGEDISDMLQIGWTDASGNYLGQSTILSALPTGMEVRYSLTLPQALAMQYALPESCSHTVADTGNEIECTLSPIPQVKISGKINDSSTSLPISGSIVTASQTFGGKYSQTITGKSDRNGEYTLTVFNVPTSLTVSASDYVSNTIVCDSLMADKENIILPQIALKPISGAVISLGFTYQKSVAEGEAEESQDWYDNYSNVTYSIFNKTKNRPVTQFNVQYPSIVLLEEVSEADVLEITATSLSGDFMPVVANVVIDDAQKGDAIFDIIELGGFRATFVKNGNASVAGSLYDTDGKLCKTYAYANSAISVNGLKDGKYTLVTMGDSRLFNNIYSLDQFPQTGLTEGNDFVSKEIEVESGRITEVTIESVPTLNEAKLYYTGDNTSFTVNKPSIVAGNYLTLTGRIDFKPAYVSDISNLSLIVDLPKECDFVENSVMVGNTTSSYTVDGNRLTIPMARITDRVRFCVIPTLGGEYSPSAFAQFNLNGETITQPIGAANYTAKDLSLSAPSIVAKTTIPVSGSAAGKSTVEIYDGDVMIGQTQSLANGTWTTTCELIEPYNLSKHEIYAKVTTKEGLNLRSETIDCTYDINAIRVSKVTMYHWNPEMHTTFTSEFDFLNPRTTPTQWTVYYPNKKFTYTIEFTNNDPEKISNVILYVHTADGRYVPLNAEYDEQKELWCADIDMGHSSDGYYPVNVSVDFDAMTEVQVDATTFNDTFKSAEISAADIAVDSDALRQACNSISELIKKDDSNIDDLSQLLNYSRQLAGISAISKNQIDFDKMAEEDFIHFCDRQLEEGEKIIDDNMGAFINNAFYQLFNDAANCLDGVMVTTTNNYSVESLIDQGATEIKRTNGQSIYIVSNELEYGVIDFENNRCILIDLTINTEPDPVTRGMKKDSDEVLTALSSYLEKTENYWDKLRDLFSRVAGLIEEVIDVMDKKNGQLADTVHDCDQVIEYIKKNNLDKNDYFKGVLEKYEKQRARALDDAISNNKIMGWLEKNISPNGLRVGKLGGGIFALIDIGLVIKDACEDINKVIQLYQSIPDPCKDDQSKADNLKKQIRNTGYAAGAFYTAQLASDVVQLLSLVTSVPAIIPSGGTSLSLVVASVSLAVANFLGCIAYEKAFEYRMTRHYRDALALQCLKNCGQAGMPECPKDPFGDDNGNHSGNGNGNGKGNGKGNGGGSEQSNAPNDNVKIDPSGFVYEAVASNRVEGVVATIFYKEMVEDMYGDLHENIVKWDAAEYAQENPLFTDEEGNYRWDVPQGLWQVRFEKEGYETTFSEWLPVPPPQLEVNIPIKQNVQPNVKLARAFEDAVEVEFDKYMQPETLSTDNIVVLAEDKPIAGTLLLLNEEETYEESGETFASKVRFNANEPFSTKEVTLLVKNRVKSYADVRMQDDYMQSFGIELEIRKIECDSVVDVAYGGSHVLKVSVVPALAAAEKTLNVLVASAMTISTDTQSVVLDKDGSAEIVINGDLPGSGALQFSIEGYDLSEYTIVNVRKDFNKVATPKISIASGSTVDQGTEVYLSCDTEGATIIYTLDGSCPCDDTDARKEYDGSPIVINDDVTIKAMAYAPDMYESEIATFVYYIADTGVEGILLDNQVKLYPLPMREELNISAGDNLIKRVSFTNLSGTSTIMDVEPARVVTVDVSRFPTGVYMITIETERGETIRKVMKVK